MWFEPWFGGLKLAPTDTYRGGGSPGNGAIPAHFSR
jgi:hypothetical protein